MSQFSHILTGNDNVRTEWVHVGDASRIVLVSAIHNLLVITRDMKRNVVEFVLKELMI